MNRVVPTEIHQANQNIYCFIFYRKGLPTHDLEDFLEAQPDESHWNHMGYKQQNLDMTIPLACTRFCNGIWDRFPFGPLIDLCATVLPSLGKLRLPEAERVPLRAGDRIRRPSCRAAPSYWQISLGSFVSKQTSGARWPSLLPTPTGMPRQQR